MNLKEFAALKIGDKVANAMSQSTGEVTEVTDQGVRVRWDHNRAGPGSESRQPVTFLYVVNGTSWFHWSKLEELPPPHWTGDEGSGP